VALVVIEMRRFQDTILAVASVTMALVLSSVPARAQSSASQIPRAKDGKPDLSGIWQAMNTANWDLQAHAAQAGHVVAMGAQGAQPGGIGVVEGGEIPYLPAALAQRKSNYEKRFTEDPEIKCYMPGVPRATYLPFPFQILQSQKVIQFAYEFAASARTIFMEKMPPAPLDSWMGQSVGRWEGDTLVVDVTSLGDQTWFDRAGDFHSDALHVVERYTPVSRDILQYQATIEDPKVFSRPWKINMPLYRHVETGARLMEFRCAQFVEELLYGQYRRAPEESK
jgi:hypothetical protein